MQIKDVKWVEIHEQYNGLVSNHDVAIVRLELTKEAESTTTIVGGLTYDEHYVEPACLPLNPQDNIGNSFRNLH